MLDCHKREEVRLVATNLCSIVTEVKKYDLLSPISARIVTEGKKYNLLLPIAARLSQKGRSTICCYNIFVRDCHRGKKYDLLPPICARHRREEVRFVASIVTRQEEGFVAHQFVLDYHRRQEVRFVATNFCSSQKRKYDALSPIFARLSQKGRSTICCHQFVLDCHRKEKYDLLPPICALLSQKGRSTISCHQFVLVTERKKYDLFLPISARWGTEGKKYDLLPQLVL